MRSVAVVLLLAFSGCATIMAGGPDRVPVSTNPPGATVFVDDIPAGQTPVMITLDRQHSRGVIRIELPGFEPVTVVRSKDIQGGSGSTCVRAVCSASRSTTSPAI